MVPAQQGPALTVLSALLALSTNTGRCVQVFASPVNGRRPAAD